MMTQKKAFNIRLIFLCSFIFFLPLSSAVHNAFLGLAIAWWIFEKVYFKDTRIFSELKIPLYCMAVIVLFGCLSFINTEFVHNSVRGIIKLLKWMLLVFVTADTLQTKRELKWVLGIWIASAFFISLDGLFQYATGHDFLRHNPLQFFNPGVNRIRATYSHATLLAGYLNPVLGVLGALGLFYFKGTRQVLFLAMSLLIGACFVLTWTRVAVLALWATILIVCWMKRNVWVPGVMLVTSVAGYFLLPSKISNWIGSQDSWIGLLFNEDRIWTMVAGFNMMKAHPWVGVGAGTFSNQYENYKLPIDPVPATFSASSYIHMGGEIGIIAVLALFVFCGWTFFKGYKAYFKMKDRFVKMAFLGMFGAALIFFIHAFMDCNLYFSKLTPIFGLVMGLIVVPRPSMGNKNA